MTEYTKFKVFTDYTIFDADQHLHEGPDCYSRHIEPQFAERTMRTLQNPDDPTRSITLVEGRPIPMSGAHGKLPRPGSLKELLRSLKKGPGDANAYQWMDVDPAWMDPQLRLQQLDLQNVEACILYSNAGGLVAERYIEDEDLYYATSWSYLKWLHEEWGFATANRMFVAPIFSFRNVERTAEQLDWFFERGGKVVGAVPGPAWGRSPGDPHFDPMWSRINDAGAVIAYHINEAMPNYKAERSRAWGEEEEPEFFTQSAWQWFWAYGDVPAQETFTSLIYANLFERFPNVRVVSAEHGCEWVPLFVNKLDKMRGMGRNGAWIGGPLKERPSEIFKRHFRVVPFWEDDITPVVEQVGREVVIAGSDFPHSEGIAFPTQFVEHLDHLSREDQKFIMLDNAMDLVK